MKKRLIKRGKSNIRLLSREEYPNMYDNQSGNYPYGYFVNDELVGRIKVTHSKDEDFYGLSKFFIKDEFRNKGIGTQLLEFVINKYGSHKLVLNVLQTNSKALSLYKKHGFIITYINNNPEHGDKFYVMTRISLPKVANTPNELLKYLNKNQEYGFIWNGKKYTDDFSNYHTISPIDFSKYHIGVCWDYANYEYEYFKEYFKNIFCQLYYIEMAGLPEEPTHTWLSYETNNKVYVIESSWESNRGIHEYDTKEEMLEDYIMKFIESYGKDEAKYSVLTYSPPAIYNMSPICFMDYVWKSGQVVRDNGLMKLLIKN